MFVICTVAVSYMLNFELTLCYVFSVFCCVWVVCFRYMFIVVCCVCICVVCGVFWFFRNNCMLSLHMCNVCICCVLVFVYLLYVVTLFLCVFMCMIGIVYCCLFYLLRCIWLFFSI